MIVFNLQCAKQHVFESWFKDSAAYERQAKRGLVACPYCGSAKVEKALMAPRLSGTKKSRKAKQDAAPLPVASGPVALGPDPATEKAAELHRQLSQLRQHIEANFDPVGDNFAEEARKIHYGEVEQRNIYGRTTAEEAQELAEEGVEFAPVPWVPDKNA
jgi:hypothetical protein